MKSKNFFYSFVNAVNGIVFCLKNEKNFRFHFFSMITILLIAFSVKVSKIEFVIILILSCLVLITEAINTAVENTIDLICGTTFHKLAKIAKDVSSGAVLITSLTALLSALLIFKDKIIFSLNSFIIFFIICILIFILSSKYNLLNITLYIIFLLLLFYI